MNETPLFQISFQQRTTILFLFPLCSLQLVQNERLNDQKSFHARKIGSVQPRSQKTGSFLIKRIIKRVRKGGIIHTIRKYDISTMPATTRSAARRRAADEEWEELCKRDFSKKKPLKLVIVKAPKTSGVSKSSPASSARRKSKNRSPSPQRPQSKSSSTYSLEGSSPFPKIRTPAWESGVYRPGDPSFKAIDWDASSSTADLSPQLSPKSSTASHTTSWEHPRLSSCTTEPADPITGNSSLPKPFRKPAKPFLKAKKNAGHSPTSSSASAPRIANLKTLNLKTTSPNSERAPCISPSCPVHPMAHNQGTYLHEGQSPKNHLTFGWSNPPLEIWAAYQKNRHEEATEDDLELIANFRAYHDQHAQAGSIITSGIINNEPEIIRKSSFSL